MLLSWTQAVLFSYATPAVRKATIVKASTWKSNPHSFPAHETNVPELENTPKLLELRKSYLHAS